MANYHDPIAPYALHGPQFPSLDQQRNFLRAYVEHRLAGTYVTKTPTTTPATTFNLDARTPEPPYKEEEAARQRVVEEEVERLVEEARVWRAASHAVWCVWGIVQAKVGSNDAGENKLLKEEASIAGDKDNEDEFNYLGYAQQRALMFWGDMLMLGLVKHEDADEFVLGNAKRVG